MADPGEYNEAGAARILSVSASTLRRWRKDGLIGFHRWPGGRISYTLDQLAAFRQQARVDPVTSSERT